MKSISILVLLVCLVRWGEAEPPKVSVEVPGYATVLGGKAKSFYEGNPYYFFHNLKYAKSPVNEARFLVTTHLFEQVNHMLMSFKLKASGTHRSVSGRYRHRWMDRRTWLPANFGS